MTFSFAQPASSGAGAPGSGFSFGAGAGGEGDGGGEDAVALLFSPRAMMRRSRRHRGASLTEPPPYG